MSTSSVNTSSLFTQIKNSVSSTADGTSTLKANATSTSSSSSSATIAADDFLTLLVTELQNQDPTTASDPNEYVNQLVAVNSLEQLIEINSAVSDSSSTSTTTSSTSSSDATSQATNAATKAHSTDVSNTDSSQTLSSKDTSVTPAVSRKAAAVAHALGHPM